MCAYRRVLLLSSIIASALFQNSARAAVGDPLDITLPDKLAAANFKQFCPTLGLSPSPLLARAIVDSYNVSRAFVDWNDTGSEGPNEYRAMVSTDLCANATAAKLAEKCIGQDKRLTAEAVAQADISRTINNRLEAGLKVGSTFNLVFKGGRLQVTHRGSPNASAFNVRSRENVAPGQESATLAEQLFATS